MNLSILDSLHQALYDDLMSRPNLLMKYCHVKLNAQLTRSQARYVHVCTDGRNLNIVLESISLMIRTYSLNVFE
jgi:hypothetical protein